MLKIQSFLHGSLPKLSSKNYFKTGKYGLLSSRLISSVHSPGKEKIDIERNPIFHSEIKYENLCKSQELITLLQANRYLNATDIQARSYETIFKGKDAIIGAETGSGKTLAYFVPILDRILTSHETGETQKIDSEGKTQNKFFKGIIFAPTGELCNQIIRMTNFAVRHFNATQKVISIDRRSDKILNWKKSTTENENHLCEFVVSTPSAIQQLLAKLDPYDDRHPLRDLNFLVLDEADMLLDGSYFKDLERILDQLRLVRRHKIHQGLLKIDEYSVQSILAAASFPTYGLKSIEKTAKRYFPHTTYIRTDYMHQHHPRISQEYISLAPDDAQDSEFLMKIIFNKLYQTIHPTTTTTTTTTTTSSSPSSSSTTSTLKTNEELSTLPIQQSSFSLDSLSSSTVPVTKRTYSFQFSNNNWLLPNQLSSSIMIFFNTANRAQAFSRDCQRIHLPVVEMHSLLPKEQREKNLKLFQDQEIRVMICTDSCARGLDLPFVKYVIQGEFALNVVQHLHRIGRASRAGKEGVAINYFTSNNTLLVDRILGQHQYDMQVGEPEEEDNDEELTKKGASDQQGQQQQRQRKKREPSTIEQAFSRRRGLRQKHKKQQTKTREE